MTYQYATMSRAITPLLLTHTSRYLLGLNRRDSSWPHEQSIEEIKRKIFECLCLILRVGVDVMARVVSVERRNVRNLDNVPIEDIQFAERFYADPKGLCRLLAFKAWVVGINVLGRNVERLPEHRARRFVPSHLAAFVGLTKQTRNSRWNVFAQLNGRHRDPDGRICKTIFLIVANIAVVVECVQPAARRRYPLVDGELFAVCASPSDLVVIGAVLSHPRFTTDMMNNVASATSHAISYKKSHTYYPSTLKPDDTRRTTVPQVGAP